MLRVGLTGGLGSGKSTAAKMFAAHGAHVLSADEIGRELMQPGQPVYAAIVALFGPSVVAPDKSLDRAALARLAFGPKEKGGERVEELNAIVHPAVIARQTELLQEIAAQDPDAVVMVESALIFETKYGGEGGWHRRFDKIIFVKSPEKLKIARFVDRASNRGALTDEARRALEAEARRRLAKQSEVERNESQCDYVLVNDGTLDELQAQVDGVWPALRDAAKTAV
jgi:dephospho-CoA kinase